MCDVAKANTTAGEATSNDGNIQMVIGKGLSMEPFTFARSSDLNLPVSVKMYVATIALSTRFADWLASNSLDGYQKPIPFSTLLKRPDLRHKGSNLR